MFAYESALLKHLSDKSTDPSDETVIVNRGPHTHAKNHIRMICSSCQNSVDSGKHTNNPTFTNSNSVRVFIMLKEEEDPAHDSSLKFSVKWKAKEAPALNLRH